MMPVKKKSKVRRSVKSKIETPVAAQPAAERRSAEAHLRTIIAKFAPDSLRLISAVRKALRKRLPTSHELIYEYRSWLVVSFSPSEQGFEGVFGIRADADGVQLYFNRGKELPDPEKLLRGSASLVRYIDLENAATLTRPAVVKLAEEAIARNTVPFATEGDGSVTIRSKSNK